MDTFNTIIFWSVAGITAIVSVLLSYTILRFQRKLAQSSADTGNFKDNSLLSFIWTLVPVAVLAILLILSFQAM